jgi:protein SCO1/2
MHGRLRPLTLGAIVAAFLLHASSHAFQQVPREPADEQVTFRIIVVNSPDAVRSTIERIERGESIEALAKEVSTDPTAARGGLVGPVAASMLRPDLREALRTLGGDVSYSVVVVPTGIAIVSLASTVVPVPRIEVDQQVPDFTLFDQAGMRVTLSSLRGTVVAMNFIYTRCAQQPCSSTSNDFRVLTTRFERSLGRDIVLLTVTLDPERDTRDVLAKYASQWNADPKTWHFLTGSVPDVRRVCAMFGVDFFPDGGPLNHALHTIVIGRTGKLVANIEANQLTPEQLGDLVLTTLNR